nr:MAG TPA: hypothetical protein [Caudoviricetes sp.]
MSAKKSGCSHSIKTGRGVSRDSASWLLGVIFG